jgi:hypothetical protein
MHYTGNSDSNKPLFNISATTEEINQHSEQVRRSQNPCPARVCPKCQKKSDNFLRHDKKNRKFQVVIEQVIHVVICLLTLWKCPECGKCFMGYPPFAMPYKRYTIPTICIFTQWYVENDAMTYRNLIQETPLLSSTYPEWELSHSSIHRWISTLGQLNTTMAKAQDFILQKDPVSTICRDLAGLTVACRKHVSEARKTLLLACRKIVEIEKQFSRLFGVSIFHQLATNCAYR